MEKLFTAFSLKTFLKIAPPEKLDWVLNTPVNTPEKKDYPRAQWSAPECKNMLHLMPVKKKAVRQASGKTSV